MHAILLKVYCSSFPAIADCTFDQGFDWPMALIRLTNSICFRVQSITKNQNMESAVWKYSVESTMHGTWKQYGNIVYVCWCQNKLAYEIVLIVHIHTLLHF